MDLWAMKHRNDTIASSLAISFAARVVQEATGRPRQLMDEPRPYSSMLPRIATATVSCEWCLWSSFSHAIDA